MAASGETRGRAQAEPVLENDMLGAVAKVLKAEGPGPPANGEKAPVIEELRATTGRTLREPAASLRMSKSPYERQGRAMARPDRYARLRERVRDVLGGANRSRGHRHVTHELRAQDEPVVVSEKVVRRTVREEALVVPHAGRRARYGPYKGEISEAPANLVARDLRADAPDRPWLTDITEFGLAEGKACLSAIVDCFDGGLAGRPVGPRPDAELADSGLRAAAGALGADEHPVLHSDRGCHYRWPGWIAICAKHGLVRSMSKKGRPRTTRRRGASSGASKTSSSTIAAGPASRSPASASCSTPV